MKIEEIVTNLQTETDINEMISICKRVNNAKRDFLFVNSYQGKHIPMSPSKIMDTYKRLNKELEKYLTEEKNRVFIAFAETATAIGYYLASKNNAIYLTTTREKLIKDKIDFTPTLIFEEEHSHAVSQLLYCEDENILKNADEIIFIDDEISTGKTIFNFIKALEEKNLTNENISYKVVSFLNWMTETNKEMFAEYDIDFVALAKGSLNTTEQKVNVSNIKPATLFETTKTDEITVHTFEHKDSVFNSTRLGLNEKYFNEKAELIANCLVGNINEDEKVLVIGTEEFMYLPLLIAKRIEELKKCSVNYHATTRSPITIANDEDYKIKTGFKFYSLNDEDRINYIYNLENYDHIFLITETENWTNIEKYKNKPTIINVLSNFTNNLHLIKVL